MILKSIKSLKIVFLTHLVDISKAPEKLQMEPIEMPENNILKSQFDNRNDPIEIWKKDKEYSCLRENARRLMSCISTLLQIYILILDANQEFAENTFGR